MTMDKVVTNGTVTPHVASGYLVDYLQHRRCKPRSKDASHLKQSSLEGHLSALKDLQRHQIAKEPHRFTCEEDR
jgi:hypothetical protein